MIKIHWKTKYIWPLTGSAVSAKFLRVLLPLIISAILIQGFLDETLSRLLNIDEALFTALLSLTFAIIVTVVIVQLSRIVFRQAEKAEIERKQAEEKNLQLASIIESSNDAIIGKTLHGIITNWNFGAEKMYGYTKEEIINQPISLIIPPDHQNEMVQILEKIQIGQHIDYYETVRQKKDGTQISVSVSISPVYNSDGALIGASTIARDITEQKRVEETIKLNEIRLESLLKISQHQTESIQELLDFALSEAITLTGSKIGYIYFYDDKKQEFTLNSWSKDVMKECTVVEQQTIYQLEKTGFWGEAVRQRKPIIDNDFSAPNPLKKGYPEGHSPLLKYLTIPVISDDRIVAVVGVANKETDYTISDVRQLTLLMDNVWQISERKRAESELRKLSRAVEQSPASIVITDTTGAIEYVNPKFVHVTGYSLEEAIGKNPRILKSGEKPSEEYKQLWDMLTSGNEWKGEFHNKKKNGELYWEYAVISPIRDEHGIITHFLAVKEDITDRKQTEQALQYERTLLRTLIDNIPDTIYSKDISCRKILANPADLKNMHVQSESEVIGKDDFAFYPKELAQEFYDDDQKVLTTGNSVINKEECIIDEHGQEHWLLTNKLPLRDKAGTIIGLAGVGRDITERKQSEEALRRSEEKFRTIFESNSSAIAIIEPDTTISMVNDAYCQLSGYTKQEVVGMIWTKQIPPDDLERLKEYNRRRLLNPQDAPDKYEFKFYKKGGEIRYGLISVSYMQGARKIITSFIDITDRKNVEQERENLINELKTALTDVKTLSGLLPICASCKKIRDDNGYWQQVEGYIQKHTEATFTHGMCPECIVKYFPDYVNDSQKGLKK